MLMDAIDSYRERNLAVFVIGVSVSRDAVSSTAFGIGGPWGTTHSARRAWQVYPPLLTAHRLGLAVHLHTPTESERLRLLHSICGSVRLCPGGCLRGCGSDRAALLQSVATRTSGFLATDLLALCREALTTSVEVDCSVVHHDAFTAALAVTTPSYQATTISVRVPLALQRRCCGCSWV